jgi:hypothetical protein
VAKGILIEEYHLTVYAPRGLAEAQYEAMRQALDEEQFQADLRRAVRRVARRHPPLDKVRLRVSR